MIHLFWSMCLGLSHLRQDVAELFTLPLRSDVRAQLQQIITSILTTNIFAMQTLHLFVYYYIFYEEHCQLKVSFNKKRQPDTLKIK